MYVCMYVCILYVSVCVCVCVYVCVREREREVINTKSFIIQINSSISNNSVEYPV